VEEFELDLDHVVEALAPLVDVVVAAATAVHFAGGLSPISECRITVVVSSKSCNTLSLPTYFATIDVRVFGQ
jgi:hypothetical protein